MQQFRSINNLLDAQFWALSIFAPLLFTSPSTTSHFPQVTRWGSVRLRQVRRFCCRKDHSDLLFSPQLRVKPQPCVGYNSSSSILCVPLEYNYTTAESFPFAFSYFSGGTLQSKSVLFNDGSPNDSLFYSLNCPFLNCPGGGYDLFFGNSEADEVLWSSLFSPNSTYIDPYTRAVYILSTFYEPSVQVRISCTPFNFSLHVTIRITLESNRVLQKYVVTHFGLQFTPSSAILSSTLFSDFFWDRSARSGQHLALIILCPIILAFVCWYAVISFVHLVTNMKY